MKLAGVEARPKKKFKTTTDCRHNLPADPNLLMRDFSTKAPGCVLVGDVTYIWTKEGWLYLAVVIDLFSRRVVGWALNRRMTKQLAIDALLMAIWRVKPIKGAMFHSDRGSQYCSHAFQRVLRLYGMRSSMSRKGDCWDNAVAESFFGTLKTELVFGEIFSTRREAIAEAIDYIEMFYNSHRLHSFLEYLPPIEFEKRWELKTAA